MASTGGLVPQAYNLFSAVSYWGEESDEKLEKELGRFSEWLLLGARAHTHAMRVLPFCAVTRWCRAGVHAPGRPRWCCV